MKLEDFIDNFEGVTICHYRKKYFQSSMHDYNGKDTFATYQFNIDSQGDYYFGLSQPDKNMYKTGHCYGLLSIVIARIEGDGYKNVIYEGGKGYPKRDVWFRTDCKPGKYLAFVTTSWDMSYSSEFSIWSYGPQTLKFERIKQKTNLLTCVKLFKQAIINKVRLYSSRVTNCFRP